MQRPLHSCCMAGHVPVHAARASMQLPRQSCRPDGQTPAHDLPSQVVVPSRGAWHGVHDAPQVRTSLSETHPPGHMCCPGGHSGAEASWAASGMPASVLKDESAGKEGWSVVASTEASTDAPAAPACSSSDSS